MRLLVVVRQRTVIQGFDSSAGGVARVRPGASARARVTYVPVMRPRHGPRCPSRRGAVVRCRSAVRKRHASAGPDRTGPDRGHPYSLSALLPVGGSGRSRPQDQRQGPRRRQCRAAQGPPRHARAGRGPYGRLSARARTRQKVALVAAGVGITPLRALAEELDYAPGDAVLLYRFTDRPLFEGELAALARERGLQAIWLPGHRRAPDSWLGDGVGGADDRTALTFRVPDIAERDVYVCGPEGWAEDVRRTTSAAGLPADHFHVESFGW